MREYGNDGIEFLLCYEIGERVACYRNRKSVLELELGVTRSLLCDETERVAMGEKACYLSLEM